MWQLGNRNGIEIGQLATTIGQLGEQNWLLLDRVYLFVCVVLLFLFDADVCTTAVEKSQQQKKNTKKLLKSHGEYASLLPFSMAFICWAPSCIICNCLLLACPANGNANVLLPSSNLQQRQLAAAELVLIIKLLLHLRLLFRVWLLSAISSIICLRLLFSCFHKKKKKTKKKQMKIRNAHKFNNFVVRLFSICVFNICLRPACCNLISLFTQVYLMPGSFVFRVLHFIIIAEDG